MAGKLSLNAEVNAPLTAPLGTRRSRGGHTLTPTWPGTRRLPGLPESTSEVNARPGLSAPHPQRQGTPGPSLQLGPPWPLRPALRRSPARTAPQLLRRMAYKVPVARVSSQGRLLPGLSAPR